MCTKPLKAAVKTYTEFIETNLLDPTIFPSVKILEREVIKKIASLFSGHKIEGYVTSGGTEGNIIALWVARKLLNREFVLAPVSAHYSVDKACDLQQIKVIHSHLDDHYRASVESIQEKVSKKTIAIVATAGTTALGLVDPIKEIAEIAKDHRCFLHVDASFGGFVLPFLKNPPQWDFGINSVMSIITDPHKMGLAPIPAGSVLFREGSLKVVERDVPYLRKTSSTLLGTRAGASAAAVWTALNLLRAKKYKTIVRRCMDLTERLAKGIKKINGLGLVVEPELNIVAFKPANVNLNELEKSLKSKNWLVSINKEPKSIRLVVMPHHRRKHITSFLSTLRECVEELA